MGICMESIEQEKLIQELLAEIKDLKHLLVGNEQYGQKGLVHDIQELKEFKSQIMKLKWYSLGAVGFASFVFVAVKYIKELFSH